MRKDEFDIYTPERSGELLWLSLITFMTLYDKFIRDFADSWYPARVL